MMDALVFLALMIVCVLGEPQDFADETNIQLWECNMSVGQKWYVASHQISMYHDVSYS